MDCYRFGDIPVTWDGGGYRVTPGRFSERFRYEGPLGGEGIHMRGKFEPLAPYREYPLLFEDGLYSVYQVNDERLLLYHWMYLSEGYGVWIDRIDRGRSDVISFDPAIHTQKTMDADWLFGVSGLYRALMNRNRTVIHASYVDWQGKAILFTAPSGTGKSTQARLWQTYENCGIINGDRVLLGERQGVWHAYGFPNCGSSDICVNRTLPIRVIVVLQQGPENRVERMPVAHKLRSLVSGMAIYHWDGADVQKAVTLAEEIMNRVSIVKLICRPDAEAVEVLKEYLEGEAL